MARVRRGSTVQFESARLHLVALVILPATRILCERVRRSMAFDYGVYPQLTHHHRELAEVMAAGLGEQARAEALAGPPEQQIARLEQFEVFVRAKADERASAEVDAQNQSMAA